MRQAVGWSNEQRVILIAFGKSKETNKSHWCRHKTKSQNPFATLLELQQHEIWGSESSHCCAVKQKDTLHELPSWELQYDPAVINPGNIAQVASITQTSVVPGCGFPISMFHCITELIIQGNQLKTFLDYACNTVLNSKGTTVDKVIKQSKVPALTTDTCLPQSWLLIVVC